MSTTFPGPPPSTRRMSQAERTLARDLEPGEHVWFATWIQTGSVVAYLAFVVVAIPLTLAIAYSVLGDSPGNPGYISVWLVGLVILYVGVKWILRNRLLVMTDSQLFVLRTREGFPFLGGGRIEARELRDSVRVEERAR